MVVVAPGMAQVCPPPIIVLLAGIDDVKVVAGIAQAVVVVTGIA